MSVIRILQQSRLGAKMSQRGGILIGDALKAAEKVILEQRENCLAEIDRALERLSNPEMEHAALYTEAANVVAMCVGPEDKAVAAAAGSLCDLLDASQESRVVDRRAIDLHVASIRALHRTNADAAVKRDVLAGLARLAAARKPGAQ